MLGGFELKALERYYAKTNLRNAMQKILNTFAKLLRLGWSNTNSALTPPPKHLLIAWKTWHQRIFLWSSTVVSVGSLSSSRNSHLVATNFIAILIIFVIGTIALSSATDCPIPLLRWGSRGCYCTPQSSWYIGVLQRSPKKTKKRYIYQHSVD